MIIRTYQRRNRSVRSLSDTGNPYGDVVGSSGSQESLWGGSQEPLPFSVTSSQESCWSQTDYGNTSRSFKSSRRQPYVDDFGEETLSAFASRPPLSRSSSERPPLTSAKRNGDGKASRSKVRKAQSDSLELPSNGSKINSNRGVERRRGEVYAKDSPENGVGSSSGKRGSEWADTFNNAGLWGPSAPPTSTLMEAQESGEMMEHVDEANFALDGLAPEQPVRVQRASLTSLLSLCGSMQRRRLLRTHGMAKPLVEAIVALPTDDSALALAAAAVLYFLASDSQDEDLLDSPSCVLFLMKLLGKNRSEPVVKKGLGAIGSRLAALSKSTFQKSGTSLGGDRGEGAVVTKVRALFESLREHGAGSGNASDENGILLGEEISSKWLALLTLEKACISTVVLEDSSAEAVRKVGGQFKERLRELGGLDAVCELAAGCLDNLTEALKAKDADGMRNVDLVALEKKDKSGGVGVLLRCLRVMENVTFLSEQNQKHLLELKLPKGKVDGTESFIGLTISAINTLSELAQSQKQMKESKHLLQSAANGLGKEVVCVPSNPQGSESMSVVKDSGDIYPGRMQTDDSTSIPPCVDRREESVKLGLLASGKNDSSVITFQRRKSLKLSSSQQMYDDSERSQATSGISRDWLDECSDGLTVSGSETQNSGKVDKVFSKRKAPQLKPVVSRKAVTSSWEHERPMQSEGGSELKVQKVLQTDVKSSYEDSQDPFSFDDMENIIKGGLQKKTSNFEDSQDPSALDDVDFDLKGTKGPKKKLKRGQSGKSGTQGKKKASSSIFQSGNENGVLPQTSSVGVEGLPVVTIRGKLESQDEGSRQEALIGDCLLSAVKVLMNLTNDNTVGCCQVAACGGLKSLSSLLIAHYPWPKSPSLPADSKDNMVSVETREDFEGFTKDVEGQSDHDLDILVTVLGVLCNLVEKDICNRRRLASLKVDVPLNVVATKEGETWSETGMIALLCSLFLAKQGAGEAAEAIETKRAMEMDDEASFKQGQAEAEDMIVEAYAALLLAFLSKESERVRTTIAQLLPDDDLKVLVPVLERFVAFHLSLNMISPETHAVVRDVIDSCKQPVTSRLVP